MLCRHGVSGVYLSVGLWFRKRVGSNGVFKGCACVWRV